MPSITLTAASGTWTAPSNISGAPRVQGWAESGNAGHGVSGSHSGASSGTGAYAEEPSLAGVVAGTVLSYVIGQGASATDTTVTGGSVAVTAAHGGNATANIAGAAGAAGSNTIARAGTAGTNGTSGTGKGGAGSPGSPGSTGSGTAGGLGGTIGGSAGSAGSGGGAPGVTGGGPTGSGSNGIAPGGGASGGGDSGNQSGGSGAPGQVIITWTVISGYPVADYAAGTGSATGRKKGTGGVLDDAAGAGAAAGTKHAGGTAKDYAAGTGTINLPPASPVTGYAAGTGSATGRASRSGTAKDYAAGYGLLAGATFNPGAVNAWSNSFAQPASFGPMPPALQGINVPLNPAYSVPGTAGTGYPTAGNWLLVQVGWNTGGLPAVTFNVEDDIHSFWRKNPPSPATGNTRSTTHYTANLARMPAVIYAAPNGAYAAAAVLVLEVASLGDWDTVTGYETAAANASTSLGLSLPAP